MIKIFADGADYNDIMRLYQDKRISGFTTNPALLKKAGVKNYEAFIREVSESIKDKPLSFEVIADDEKEMIRQAEKIQAYGDNIYVKIPITYTGGEYTSRVIGILSSNKIQLNVTAITTRLQVEYCTNSFCFGLSKSIISVFAGRISDTGKNAKKVIKSIKEMVEDTTYSNNTELLWASTREIHNIKDAEECGCDIITIGPDILKKLDLIGKNLNDMSLDAVRGFYKDALDSGYTL